jgi:hypothetical protein
MRENPPLIGPASFVPTLGRSFGTGILNPWGDEPHRTNSHPTSSFAAGCRWFSALLLISRLVATDQVLEGKRPSFQQSAKTRASMGTNLPAAARGVRKRCPHVSRKRLCRSPMGTRFSYWGVCGEQPFDTPRVDLPAEGGLRWLPKRVAWAGPCNLSSPELWTSVWEQPPCPCAYTRLRQSSHPA